jgi:hypothetical protein
MGRGGNFELDDQFGLKKRPRLAAPSRLTVSAIYACSQFSDEASDLREIRAVTRS